MCGVNACHFGDAARAALTAASTSAPEPCPIDASFSPLEGSKVSKYSPADGFCQAPWMKCPKRRSWRSSQAVASLGSSGAGPYSMVANFSAILIRLARFLPTTQADGDTPPNSVQSRDAPVAAQCLPEDCSRQSETILRAPTTIRVPLSSWIANPVIAWQFESRPPA